MAVTSSIIEGIITGMETAFPGAVLKMFWGDDHGHSVNVLRSDTTENDDDGNLGGVIPGTRGRLRLILSRCSPWDPPAQGEQIVLQTHGFHQVVSIVDKLEAQ